MAMMTGKEYVESLRAMNLRVYMFGKRVENPVDDPILRPSVNSVRMTYLYTTASGIRSSTGSPTSTSPPRT